MSARGRGVRRGAARPRVGRCFGQWERASGSRASRATLRLHSAPPGSLIRTLLPACPVLLCSSCSWLHFAGAAYEARNRTPNRTLGPGPVTQHVMYSYSNLLSTSCTSNWCGPLWRRACFCLHLAHVMGDNSAANGPAGPKCHQAGQNVTSGIRTHAAEAMRT